VPTVSPAVEEQLELQEAADALGVHYQTAYRWVRSGRLPAQVVGGRYRVIRSDLVQVDVQRRTPSAPKPPSDKRLHHQVERMYDALVIGNEAQARLITHRLVGEGTNVVVFMQRVLVPALSQIGDAWQRGDLPIWSEHRASAIAERVLAELSPNPRGRRRGVVAVAAVSGDHHSLPTMMATVALRDANWQVHHLGADTPPAELLRFCTKQPVDLAVLTVTNPKSIKVAERAAADLRAAGIRTIVGGPGRMLDDLLDRALGALPSGRARPDAMRSGVL
jgi:MerR family transcriptional regulator, light-induced transcriptional regulator